jgi:hypothetical protein
MYIENSYMSKFLKANIRNQQGLLQFFKLDGNVTAKTKTNK